MRNFFAKLQDLLYRESADREMSRDSNFIYSIHQCK